MCHAAWHPRSTEGSTRYLSQIARLSCAATALMLAACQPPEPGRASPPELRLDDVKFRAYRGSELSMRGTAGTAVYRRQSGELTAARVEVAIPQPGGAELRVAAPVVQGDVPARAYRASGGVVATRGDDEARTPSARWSGDDGMIRGDEPVEMRGPGYRLSGPSFTLDPATGDLAIRGGVRVVASAGREVAR